jgi:hypothetical protein
VLRRQEITRGTRCDFLIKARAAQVPTPLSWRENGAGREAPNQLMERSGLTLKEQAPIMPEGSRKV